MKTGIELIAAERERQISREGYTAEHDDRHHPRELVAAAKCYMDEDAPRDDVPLSWPWEDESWKPTTRTRNLEKAGALIAAAIDILNRQNSELSQPDL